MVMTSNICQLNDGTKENMSTGAWKFKELKFPKPDLEVFLHLYKDATERVEAAKHGDDIIEILFEVDELSRRVTDLLTSTMIRHSMDTTNERYMHDQQWYEENQPSFMKAILDFNDAIYNSPYKDYVKERVGPMYFVKTDIKRKTFCEENIPLQQREFELLGEYDALMATCQEEVLGEPRSFGALQSLFSHEDREVRKTAFQAFAKFLKNNEEQLEKIWDELLKVRNQMGKNLGYDNYIPLAYLERLRLDYTQEDVARFRQQVVDEIVPLCTKLFERQKERLGLDELKFYDERVLFADGNAKPLGDADYLFNETVKMLRDMSPETDEFINFMLEHELIDYETRPDKALREYATILPARKAPFVFYHFDGTPSGLKSFHEGLGYAFAGYKASRRQHLEEYYASSSDIMEIHAMSMVQFANKYADSFFGEDAQKYVYSVLHNYLSFIPFSVAVDEFQHICYANMDMTPKERTRVWRDLENKYMPWRNYDNDEFMERGGYWYHKPHFFFHPFFYIEYSLATINAMEMYRKYEERPGTAWKEYLELTDLGGSKGYLETLELSKLTPPFLDGAVKNAIQYVKTILEDYA